MKIIAHRGFSSLYPENTMLAFKKAFEMGVYAIELDVHLSKNKELIIIHDEKIDRTSDGSGFIKDHSLEELQKYSFSYNKNFENIKISDIDEYFSYFKDKDIITNIEVKTNVIEYENIEKLLMGKIYAYGLVDKIIISSFNLNSLKRIREIDTEIPLAYLTSKKVDNIKNLCKDLNLQYYHPKNTAVSQKEIIDLKNMGVLTNIWFSNKKEDYEKLEILNPNGIITNHVEKFIKKI